MHISSSSFRQWPNTALGKWAVGLGVAFLAAVAINIFIFAPRAYDTIIPWWRTTLLPVYAISMMMMGLMSGVLGVFAITRVRERSWLVWLTLLPGAFVLIFLLGEFLFPH